MTEILDADVPPQGEAAAHARAARIVKAIAKAMDRDGSEGCSYVELHSLAALLAKPATERARAVIAAVLAAADGPPPESAVLRAGLHELAARRCRSIVRDKRCWDTSPDMSDWCAACVARRALDALPPADAPAPPQGELLPRDLPLDVDPALAASIASGTYADPHDAVPAGPQPAGETEHRGQTAAEVDGNDGW